ncbi:MAG: hypothetical protein OEZ34_15905 [Spirochaetia bacterium]|nr:hypothetical protein [Spirochaetia bacterium]
MPVAKASTLERSRMWSVREVYPREIVSRAMDNAFRDDTEKLSLKKNKRRAYSSSFR